MPGSFLSKKLGKKIFMNPAIVRLIAENFIPVVIYTNENGKNTTYMEYFEEKASGNPVIHCTDHKFRRAG